MTAALEAALDQALNELEKMREQEGEALKKELRERVQKIESLVPVIEASGAQVSLMLIASVCKNVSGELLNRGRTARGDRSIAIGPGSCLSCGSQRRQ